MRTDIFIVKDEYYSGKEIEVTAIWGYDYCYGADADGRRGVGVWELRGLRYDIPKGLSNNAMIDLHDVFEQAAEKRGVPDES